LPRTDASGTTVYLPGGQEILINGSEVSATRYYSFAGKTVAVRSGTGMGGVSSLVCDPHGSVVASVPNTVWTATSVKRVFSDPFGAVRGGSDAGVPGDHRFLGAVRDTGSGLTLLGARYYDEAVGQFISVDPKLDASEPAQFNAYSYAFNNPATLSDPSGMDPKDHQIAAWAAASSSQSGVTTTSGASKSPPSTSIAALVQCSDAWCRASWIVGSQVQVVKGVAESFADLVVTATGIPALVSTVTDAYQMITDWDGYNARKTAEAKAMWDTMSHPGAVADAVYDEYLNNPGHLAGLVDGAVLTFAVPGGAELSGLEILSDAARAMRAAKKTADAALDSGRTSGGASGLSVNGQVFTGVSNQGPARVLNSTLDDALNAVSNPSKYHGHCAEISCLNQALSAGVDPSGGTMRTVAIGTSNPGHGLQKVACSSCAAVMKTLGVN
jgi:RHS repeat-associated protein